MDIKTLSELYLTWLRSNVEDIELDRGEFGFTKLFKILHSYEFTWTIDKDKHRASDGECLRYRFLKANGLKEEIRNNPDYSEFNDAPCTVLEMMIGLAVKCEESVMANPDYGDRTYQWFWQMVVSMGLGNQYDRLFNEAHCRRAIECFLKHEYALDGHGGLYTLKGFTEDVRKMDIWSQMLVHVNKSLHYAPR